jgi:hypothetical protein
VDLNGDCKAGIIISSIDIFIASSDDGVQTIEIYHKLDDG